jgi:DNA-binding transcriptional MerR regulator
MEAFMRIGELARRTGVSPELLRAWEQRYDLLRPTRSSGGFRLYSPADESRVRRTKALIADGVSAAEAARLAGSDAPELGDEGRPLVGDLAATLREAMERYDAAGAHAAIDRLFSTVSLEFAVTEVLIPYLRDLGERWAAGRVSVAQEHFAANLVRGRLLGVAGDWGSGGHPTAVLACMPREHHDLGLVVLGILLARRGWRVTFLGADTPFDTLETGVRRLQPALVVLATVDDKVFHHNADAVAALAAATRVGVVAPVDREAITAIGAEPLVGEIAEVAAALAAAG